MLSLTLPYSTNVAYEVLCTRPTFVFLLLFIFHNVSELYYVSPIGFVRFTYEMISAPAKVAFIDST